MPSAPACFNLGISSRTCFSSMIVSTATHPETLKCDMVGLRIANLGSALATLATWATVNPQSHNDTALARDLPEGGGQVRLEISSLRLKASLAGVGIGDLELPAAPVTLVLAVQSDRFVTIADLRVAPP